jgi:septum site-determining protein MinD
VAAGKDGSGKTFFASNLGAMLSLGGAAVCLVDLNYGMRGLDLAFGLESEIVYDLSDVFAGDATLRQAEVPDERFETLSVFSCPQDIRKEYPAPAQVRRLFDELRKSFDFIIVDLPGGPLPMLADLVSGIDKAVIVTTPAPDCLRNAESVNEILRAKGVPKRFVLLNKVKPDLYADTAADLAERVVDRLRVPLVGMILYDDNVAYSALTGVPLVTEDSSLTDSFRRICLELAR